jgi:pimeloyl-ACP methyl ester carboxylesterase
VHVHINGTSIHFSDTGVPDAQPVLFVHGFPFSSAMWDAQVEAVNPRHRAICYDIRGLGQSHLVYA